MVKQKPSNNVIQERMLGFIATLRRWGIIGDVRSALVASAVGSLAGITTVALSASPSVERFIFTSEDGYAQPMRSLVDPLHKSDPEIAVRFDPQELEELYVCEYARITGFTAREVFFYVFRQIFNVSLC